MRMRHAQHIWRAAAAVQAFCPAWQASHMCLTKRHMPRSFSTSEYASQAKVSTGPCKDHSEENQGLPYAPQDLQSCHLKRRPELIKLIELFHGFPKTLVCCPLLGSTWLHYRWKSPF